MQKPLTRVCFVIPSLEIGGTERQLIALMEGLVTDHELTVICTRYDGTLAGDARRLGAYVRMAEAWSGWDFTLERRIRNMFWAHRPDVVHSFMFGFDLPVNRAARETGVPVVISSRRQRATWKKGRHIRIQKKANKLVDCIVANSNAVADFASEQEAVDRDFIRVIYNGINADTFASTTPEDVIRARYEIPPDKPIVGMVANFSPVKDHLLFLKAADLVLQHRPDAHMLLVGSGPERQAIMHKVQGGRHANAFTQVATLQEIADLYKIMTVSVLTSKTEGFPNAVVEAMVSGKPVVAPAVGGVPEQIEDGATGILIKDRKPESFATAINHLLDHPEEAAAMGQRAAESVRARFAMDAMVDSYRRLYRELLVRSTRRSA